jgi:small-conductance mechanosensitive channel
LFFLVVACQLHAEEENTIAASPEAATLTVWQREIAVFRASIAGLAPEQRRDIALSRLRSVSDFSLYHKVSSQPVSVGNVRGVSFLSDKHFLFTLIEADIDTTSGATLQSTAEEVLHTLESLRIARLNQRSPKVILRAAAISVAATIVFAALLWGLLRTNRAARRFFVRRALRISQLKRRELDLRPAFLQISHRITGLVLAAIGFSAAYIWITAVLAQFPYTSAWAEVLGHHVATLGGSLLSGALSSLPNVLIVIALFFLTRGTVRLTDQILRSFEKSDEESQIIARDTARATRRIASVLIWIFGLVIAYPYIPGSGSEAFKGISVLAGLMISLGSTGLVNQIMSGFVVLYSGAVRTGEFARVGDVEGVIAEIGLLSTKVLTAKNEYVTVPNAVLIGKDTLNYSRVTNGRQPELSTSVTIGYDAPWRQVHELLLLAAQRTAEIRKTPAPHVVQTALSDFYVEYSLRFVPAEITKKGAVLSSLHQQIQDAFHQAGVQIMSPNFVAQPAQPVIPAMGGTSDTEKPVV